MAGTISFGGVGSGLDTESIVTGLVQASRGPIDQLKARSNFLNTSTQTLTKLSGLLGKLKTALEAVDETREVGSYKASSSNAAVAASAVGTALPGSYSISVEALAAEQRTYSNGFSSSTTALGQSGTLNLSVAGGPATGISIEAGDTLESIASKINASGLRVGAAVFHDGAEFRLQVRGLDSGAANTIAFSGTTFGLDVLGNTRQAASDARVKIDNFTVTRPTNQISGAIQGVTLALAETTESPVTVKVESDPEGLKRKLQSVVDAFNAVVDSVHAAAGHGTTKGSDKYLSGDSLLRSVTSRLSGALQTSVGSGAYTTLGSLGVSITREGRVSLDGAKLDAALAADPSAVARVIAGPSSDANGGAADVLRGVVEAFTASGTGLIANRQEALSNRSKELTQRIAREEDRLGRYAELLRKQFTVMDGKVASANGDASYLINYFGV